MTIILTSKMPMLYVVSWDIRLHLRHTMELSLEKEMERLLSMTWTAWEQRDLLEIATEQNLSTSIVNILKMLGYFVHQKVNNPLIVYNPCR